MVLVELLKAFEVRTGYWIDNWKRWIWPGYVRIHEHLSKVCHVAIDRDRCPAPSITSNCWPRTHIHFGSPLQGSSFEFLLLHCCETFNNKIFPAPLFITESCSWSTFVRPVASQSPATCFLCENGFAKCGRVYFWCDVKSDNWLKKCLLFASPVLQCG